MIKKWLIRFISLFLLALFASYFIPTNPKDFFKLYAKEDTASKELQSFLAKPTKTILFNDVAWEYYASGNGKKTILFIHGMGGAYELWWQQVAAFENDYNIITFSLPEPIDNLFDASEGVINILNQENIETLHIVGTSMGGYIAQYLTYKIPDRIEKVVFSNTFPPNTSLANDNKSKLTTLPYLPEILISELGKKQLKNKLVPAAKDSELLAAFLPSLQFSKKQFLNRFYIVIDSFTSSPTRPEIIEIPKLIIEADNDPLVKKELREALKNMYPNAEVKTFTNEGHFPYINAAKEYNTFLKDFLNKQLSTSNTLEKDNYYIIKGYKKIDTKSYMLLDYVNFSYGDDAVKEAKKFGDASYDLDAKGDTIYYLENDIYFSDLSSKQILVAISDTAEIRMIDFDSSTTGTKQVDLNLFLSKIKEEPFMLVSFNNGIISKMIETYVP